MYGNHPMGTKHKRDLKRGKSIARPWRTSEKTYPVKVRKVAA